MKKDRIIVDCQQCKKEFETRPYLINIGKGKFCSKECYNKNRIGRRYNLISLQCQSCGKEIIRNRFWISEAKKRGRKHPFCNNQCVGDYNAILMKGPSNCGWKGGISPRSLNTKEYKKWRLDVFTRDEFTCQKCGKKRSRRKGIDIQAHHIMEWAKYPKLRFEILNGITLCIDCHKDEHYSNKTLTI